MINRWRDYGALALLILVAAPARADYQTGRVSHVHGDLLLRGRTDSDVSYVRQNSVVRDGDVLWTDKSGEAEVELTGGSWIRLAENTKLEIVSFGGDPELRIWNGSVYVDQSDRSRRNIRVATPCGDLGVERASLVRIDLADNDRVRVSSYRGHCRAHPPHGSAIGLPGGRRLYLEPQSAATPEAFDAAQRDPFDDYQLSRSKYYQDRPLPSEVGGYVTGVHDLSDSGEWITVERAHYWRPRVAPEWRPYSSGYWTFIPGIGYTWVSSEPWGYATCHYGRWRHTHDHGWLWLPTTTWAPAYVHWASYPGYRAWAPLDPWDRPASYGGGGVGVAFRIGSVVIDLEAFTFCRQNDFLYNRPAIIFAGGGRPYYTSRQVNITRVTVNNFRTVNNIYLAAGVPRYTARGATFNGSGQLARSRALAVESRIPAPRNQLIRSRFKVDPQRDVRLARRSSPVEGIQRNPRTALRPGWVVKNAAAARLAPPQAARRPRSPGEVRGLKLPVEEPIGAKGVKPTPRQKPTPAVRPGIPRTPAAKAKPKSRDEGFRRSGPSPGKKVGKPGPGKAGARPAPRNGAAPALKQRSAPVPRRRTKPGPKQRATSVPRGRTKPAPKPHLAPTPREHARPAPRQKAAPIPRERARPAPRERGRPVQKGRSAPPTPKARVKPAPKQRSAPTPRERAKPDSKPQPGKKAGKGAAPPGEPGPDPSAKKDKKH